MCSTEATTAVGFTLNSSYTLLCLGGGGATYCYYGHLVDTPKSSVHMNYARALQYAPISPPPLLEIVIAETL